MNQANPLPLDAATRDATVRLLLHRRLARSLEDAEDAVQAAALDALTTRRPFDGRSKFSSWFSRVAINRALMRMRGLQAQIHLELPESLPARQAWPDYLLRARLAAALAKLTPLRRTAALAFYMDDMSIKEIAKEQHCTELAIKHRIHQAREALRRELSACREN